VILPGTRSEEAADGSVRLRRIRAPLRGPLRRPGQFLAGFRGLISHGHGTAPVHLFCLSPFNLGAATAARLTRRQTQLRLSTWQEVEKVRSAPAGSLWWRLFRTAARWEVPTASLARGLSDHGIAGGRIVVQPNPLWEAPPSVPDEAERLEARRRLGLASGPVALVLGRLSPEKRPLAVLEAWSRTPRTPGARLLVVGDGPLRGEVARRAAQPDLAASVTLLPWQEDPALCLTAADLLVSASPREAFANAIAEAMAFGLAVATPAVGFVAEWVRDGDEALIVPSGQPAELSSALGRLLADGELRRRLGGAAHREIIARYSAEPLLALWIKRHTELAA